MKFTEQANGVARTEDGVTIVFPFGTDPYLVFFEQRIPIEEPERFGAWGTSDEQQAFMRAFVAPLRDPRWRAQHA